jgi:hypothetical protein
MVVMVRSGRIRDKGDELFHVPGHFKRQKFSLSVNLRKRAPPKKNAHALRYVRSCHAAGSEKREYFVEGQF